MRIDVHTHCFPMPGVHDVVARTANRFAPVRPPLGLSAVARLQQLPGPVATCLEKLSSVGIVAPLLAGGSVAGLIASMQRYDIDRSLLIAARGAASNEFVLETARRNANLVPVVVSPDPKSLRGTTPEAWRDGWAALAEAGAAGFKIHAPWDGIPAPHDAYEAAFDIAARSGKFVILHTGCFHVLGYRTEAPVDIESFEPYFRSYPDVRVCLAHMHRGNPPAAWSCMRRYEQLFTDTSWQQAATIRAAVQAVGSERIMLGSDWPLLHLGLQGESLRAVRDAVSGRHLDNILGASALRFLGAA